MDAATLNCPMCGAAARSNATRCEHCQARLATVACPACFGMLFLGAKYCPHCGEKAARTTAEHPQPRQCPGCHTDLQAIALGRSTIHECPQCTGLWVDVETFQEICADRETQTAVLGGATPDPLGSRLHATLEEVRYRPCPICQTLMNRANFSDRSGIIIDVCRGHGSWFDRDELRRIVEFIHAGGLAATRARDLQRWEMEKRRKTPAGAPATIEHPLGGGTAHDATDLISLIEFVGRAIFDFLKK